MTPVYSNALVLERDIAPNLISPEQYMMCYLMCFKGPISQAINYLDFISFAGFYQFVNVLFSAFIVPIDPEIE